MGKWATGLHTIKRAYLNLQPSTHWPTYHDSGCLTGGVQVGGGDAVTESCIVSRLHGS